MTRKQYALMLGLVIVSGLIGGSLTSWMVSGRAVAQGANQTTKVLQAERLQILDTAGQVRIELSAQGQRPGTGGKAYFYDRDGNLLPVPGTGIIRDAEGNIIGTTDSTGVDLSDAVGMTSKARVEIRNRNGKIIWSAPPETEAMFVH